MRNSFVTKNSKYDAKVVCIPVGPCVCCVCLCWRPPKTKRSKIIIMQVSK